MLNKSWMNIEIITHAKDRMSIYGITEEFAKSAVENPDSVVEGQNNRKIAQKKLNGYILRVIYEERNSTKVIVTAYKARSDRYEI